MVTLSPVMGVLIPNPCARSALSEIGDIEEQNAHLLNHSCRFLASNVQAEFTRRTGLNSRLPAQNHSS